MSVWTRVIIKDKNREKMKFLKVIILVFFMQSFALGENKDYDRDYVKTRIGNQTKYERLNNKRNLRTKEQLMQEFDLFHRKFIEEFKGKYDNFYYKPEIRYSLNAFNYGLNLEAVSLFREKEYPIDMTVFKGFKSNKIYDFYGSEAIKASALSLAFSNVLIFGEIVEVKNIKELGMISLSESMLKLEIRDGSEYCESYYRYKVRVDKVFRGKDQLKGYDYIYVYKEYSASAFKYKFDSWYKEQRDTRYPYKGKGYFVLNDISGAGANYSPEFREAVNQNNAFKLSFIKAKFQYNFEAGVIMHNGQATTIKEFDDMLEEVIKINSGEIR